MNGLPDDARGVATPRSARFGRSTHDLEHGLKHARVASQSDDDDDDAGAAIRLTSRGDSDDEDEIDELPRANGKSHPLRSPDATPRRSRTDLSLNGRPAPPYQSLH